MSFSFRQSLSLQRVISVSRVLRWPCAMMMASAGLWRAMAAEEPKLVPVESAAPKVTAEQSAFFETKIRPVLIDNCLKCHGEKKQSADLRLDSRAWMLKGNDSGPAIVPGDPDKGTLIKAVRYTDEEMQMPPSKKLPDAQIADLEAWVKMGAPWPSSEGAEVAAPTKGEWKVTAEDLKFWAFTPVRKVAPPKVKNAAWPKSPIDNFVLAKLEAKGLTPAPKADRRTLIRRAYFDLIGLPPSPEAVMAFVADKSPDAWPKLIDKLLASPSYGERWGRYWLDVSRYADSNGLDENVAFGNAWRYRDYVINSFNEDKPYHHFIQEQIAGDLMPSDDAKIRNARLTATGFLSLGAKVLAEPDKPKLQMDIVDEQIETTTKAVMGLTVSCARCHDHKFDPISTKDYYALAGIFKSTRTMASLNTVARVNQRPLTSPEIEANIKTQQAKVKVAESEAKKIADAANAALQESWKRDVGKYLLAGWDLAQQPGVYSLAETPAKAGQTRILLEAEKFDRGNFNRDFNTYGKDIGVIHTIAGSDNAEWDFEIPAAGNYQIELRYTAEEPRPVRLKLGDKVLAENAAKGVTGSWGPNGQKWEVQGTFAFAAGKNTLRLEPKGAIPHIDKLFIVSKTDASKTNEKPRSAAEIAQSRGLNPLVLQAWAQVLHPLLEAPEFQTWNASAKLADNEFKMEAAKVAARVQAQDAAFKPLLQVLAGDKTPFDVPEKVAEFYPDETKTALAKANQEVKKAKDAVPAMPMAIAVTDDKIENTKVHIRGSILNLGPEVPRRFLTVVAGENQTPIGDKTSGRLELAQWLTGPKHPLTSRVAVNRIWQGHFVDGLVRTPDNFGKMGEKPSHPELLDWLAATFIEKGWSMKAMHRLIMLSNSYQMSSDLNPKANELDPDNRLFWRMNRRRLEVEPFRDALLQVAGNLDPKMGGTLLATRDTDYVTNDQSGDGARYTAPRRSIYLPVIRNSVYDMFQAFDFSDPSAVVAKRASTTVAPQALFIMNSPFVLEQSKLFAQRLLSQAQMTDAQRIRAAYLRAFGRSPQPNETARITDFVTRYEKQLASKETDVEKRRLKAWQSVCQVLMASNEFIYVN